MLLRSRGVPVGDRLRAHGALTARHGVLGAATARARRARGVQSALAASFNFIFKIARCYLRKRHSSSDSGGVTHTFAIRFITSSIDIRMGGKNKKLKAGKNRGKGTRVSSPKPGTHHAIFVVCWTQRRRKDDCCMVCAHQRQLSPVDFTNATVVGPIRKTNRSNNCCMVCAGQRHLSHQPTGHRPITVKHFRDA